MFQETKKIVFWGVVLGLVAVLGFVAVGQGLEGIRVLAWVKYADIGEEWSNMQDILEAAGADVSTTETEDPDELLALLEGVDVLIIPEQEEGGEGADLLPAGEKLAPAFVDFLSRGKRIVSLAFADGGNDLLRGAGLTTVDDDASVTGDRLRVVAPEHWLVEGIPTTFAAPNATTDYRALDLDAGILVVAEEETPVVFHLQRHGGEIIFLGFDFFRYTETTKALLIAAVVGDGDGVIDDEDGPRPLVPAVPQTGDLEPGARTEAREEQFILAVAEAVRVVGVKLAGDLDLHIRSERLIEFRDHWAVADISLLSPGGELALISTTVLTGDRWLFAIENPTDATQTFSLVAVPVPTISVGPYPVSGRIEVPPIGELVRFLQTEEGLLGLVQYKVSFGFLDGFETGNFATFPWRTGGDAPWSVTAAEAHSGLYSARAGAIGHGESTYLEVTLEVGDGDVSFRYMVSSERGFDHLRFYIDGERVDSWSGEVDWARATHPVSAGTRTFRWEYTKDGCTSEGDDTAWIDDISLPPVGERLKVTLQSAEAALLHIRYGEPVEVRGGEVVADFTVRGEFVAIRMAFLKPGIYFIAVEGLQPPQDYEIVVELY